MNCANHADQSAVAYCRTCGKPLCAGCTRPVRGVIYCEDCLGARMEGSRAAGSVPAAGFVAGTVPPGGVVPPYMAPPVAPVPSASGPNPTVAGILAGFFPFGVGSVYTGQYAKGLAHLAIFGLLVAGCSVASESSHGDVLGTICGLGIAFFYVYQIIDAVRSARALQAGLPPPDPYGLAASFGASPRVESSSAVNSAAKVPVSAIVLILLGALFLLHTAGLFERGFDKFWPVILIALGGWLFARNYGGLGASGFADSNCRRRLMGPVMLFTVGVLCLLDTLEVAGFNRTWPVILLVVGAAKLIGSTASPTAGNPPLAGAGSAPAGFVPPPVPTPPAPPTTSGDGKSSEVNNG